MNNFIDNIVIFLSHPFVILLFLVIIGYCIWYRKSGQEQRNKEQKYNKRKQEIKEEQEKLNELHRNVAKEKAQFEQEKEEFENIKNNQNQPSIVYVKESSSTITILLIFLIISIFINVYLLHELQEYYHIFGELKEMSEFLQMLL